MAKSDSSLTYVLTLSRLNNHPRTTNSKIPAITIPYWFVA
jgi:hypothetical protein